MVWDKLFDAIYNNDFEMFKEVIDENLAIDVRNQQGYTLLHAAVSVNRFDIVEYLLKNYKVPIDVQCFEGRSPFFLACEDEIVDFPIIKLLLKYKANVNLPNNEGCTPLQVSCQNGNIALIKLLLGNNALITVNENNGYTILHYIALSNCVKSLKLFLNTIDINAKDFDGCTALMLAVDVANFDIAIELVRNGADVNIIGRDTSALHLSIVTQQPEIFEVIWEKTHFNTLKKLEKKNNLVKLLIKYGWFFPDRLPILFQVLNHENILEILGDDIKILTVFFYRIRFVKNINEIDSLSVVKKFLQIGIQVNQHDVRVFLLDFYKLPQNFEILNELIKNGGNIDEKSIIKFTIELYPRLIPKLMLFCIKTNPIDIINYFTEILRINKSMIKLLILMLYFCTPNFTLKQELKEHLTNFCCALINYGEGDEELIILYDYIVSCLKSQSVPSLKELARDVFRKYLAQFCENSNDYLIISSRFVLAKDIVNIINCTFPVNILIDF